MELEERHAPAPAGKSRAHSPPSGGTKQVRTPLVPARELQWHSARFAVLRVTCVSASHAALPEPALLFNWGFSRVQG